MANQATNLATAEVDEYIEGHNAKPLLRFITCGSVDDGKSTLIGRLLYEAQLIFDDQLVALEADSKRVGTQGDELDLALLMDGLAAEREQGITIDVAYRYFSTDKRTFIVADTPGHEQYTRNMVTGASTADCAIVLLDARKGVLTQSRRHMTIVSLLGIRHVVIAVNKMDLVDGDPVRFRQIEEDIRDQAARIGLNDVTCIPLVALTGANVIDRDDAMGWYDGPTLMEYLESVELDEERMQAEPFRLPVQYVIRPNLDFRGFAGTLVGGSLAVGDPVVVLPSQQRSRVARIVTRDRDLDRAVAGQAVVVSLADEIDVSRGDVLAHPDTAPQVGDQFEATVVWMGEEPLLPGREYLMRIGTVTATVTVGSLRHKLDVDTLDRLPATQLRLNEIAEVHLGLDRRIPFDAYRDNRETGGFIFIDRITYNTVGAGLLHFALFRSSNVTWQPIEVNKQRRAELKRQKPALIWLTGLSGAGKSTIANLVDQRLNAMGRHTYILDGDNVRHGLCRDLGFTPADRVENLRRVGETARLMLDAGLIVIASFISPYRSERDSIRSHLQPDEFYEVFVDTPLEVAEQRDGKGLYAKARRGELKNFTGIDAPYEAPPAPELRIDTTGCSPEEASAAIIELLSRRGRSGALIRPGLRRGAGLESADAITQRGPDRPLGIGETVERSNHHDRSDDLPERVTNWCRHGSRTIWGGVIKGVPSLSDHGQMRWWRVLERLKDHSRRCRLDWVRLPQLGDVADRVSARSLLERNDRIAGTDRVDGCLTGCCGDLPEGGSDPGQDACALRQPAMDKRDQPRSCDPPAAGEVQVAGCAEVGEDVRQRAARDAKIANKLSVRARWGTCGHVLEHREGAVRSRVAHAELGNVRIIQRVIRLSGTTCVGPILGTRAGKTEEVVGDRATRPSLIERPTKRLVAKRVAGR